MYRIVYMTLSESKAELSKFFREIHPKDLKSKPILFGLKFLSQFQTSNFFKILDYMVNNLFIYDYLD